MLFVRTVLALLTCAWLVGCGGTDLKVEPTRLQFQAVQGGIPPEPQTVKATFKGAAVIVGLPPGVTEPSWLAVSNGPSDESSASFVFGISTTDLSPGTYTVTIRFVTGTEEGKDLKSQDIFISYTVQPPLQPFAVAPARLDFSARSGQAELPAALSVVASADASQPVSFTVNVLYSGSTQDWLGLSATSGTTPQPLQIRPKTTALAPGQYFATLAFIPGNGKPTIQVPVTYTVGTSSFSVTPARLDFRAVSSQSALPAAQSVSVAVDQGQAVSYSVSTVYTGGAQDWLSVPTSGVTPQSFSFQPRTTALPAGNYSAVLTFTPNNNLPAFQLTVTYTVTAPAIAVSPTQLNFTAYSGQSAAPAAQNVSVTADQGMAVSYSVSATYTGGAQDWLTLPSSGTTPQTLSLRPNTTALAGGQYSAVVRLTPSNGQPAVQATVTYTVTAPAIAVSPTQLSFAAYSGQSAAPAAQNVSVTADQGMAVSYSVSATYTGGAQGWLTLPSSGTTPQTLSLQPNTTALAGGQYSAVVQLTPNNGRPAVQVTVTYTVMAPAIAVSPTQVSFTAARGQTTLPTALSVSVTADQGTAAGYSVSATYTGGAQDWLSLPSSGTTPQTLNLQPNTTDLPAGQYSAVVRFTPSNGRPAVQVTVTYTVSTSDLRASPSAPAFRVDAATTEAQLTTQLALTSTGAPLDWHVISVSAPWLDNTLVSGNTQTGTALNVVVLKSALAGMTNGAYSGSVTLGYSTASTAERQLVVNVQLNLTLPQVRTVTPYAVEAGRSLSHILRGEGFSGLQSSQSLHFGAITVSTFQVVSDTEIRLTVPALPVGDHLVLADNALGVSRPGATLHAVQTPAFAEFSLPRNHRRPERTIYDPLRTAIYTVDSDYSTQATMGLYRTRYVNGTWQEALYVYLPNIYDAAMDVDGQSLYLSIGTGLYRLDLNDDTATPHFLRTIPQYSLLAVMNDGYLLVVGNCTLMATSQDGRRALTMSAGCNTSQPVRTFEASNDQYQTTPIQTFRNFPSEIALDRTARYGVIANSIYDAQWNLIAGLTHNLYGLTFSPDSRRLFGFFEDSSSLQRLQVYDVSQPPSGGLFPRIYDNLVSGGTGSDVYINGTFLTPDGRTLILVSENRVYVWPIPSNLQ